MTGPFIGPSAPTDHTRPYGPSIPADGSRSPDLSGQQVEDLAREVLDTGVKFLRDDYGARAEHFAEVVADLSPADADKLVQEVMRQDPGALNSWLNVENFAQMHAEGRISDAEYTALSNGIAEAYNNGTISDQEMTTFLGHLPLGHAPFHAQEQYTRALEFIDAGGDTDAMNQFREDFSGHLLSQSLVERPTEDNHFAPGLAMQLAHGSGDPGMASRVFNDVLEANGASPEVREQLLTAIGNASNGFEGSAEAMDGLINPLAVLIDSVATQPNTDQWNDIAVGIVSYAEGAGNRIFLEGDTPKASTAEALGNLLGSEHGDAILTALTNMDMNIVADGNAQAFGQNAIELGNLLRLTVLNPDNPNADAAMQTVESWTQDRKDMLNGVERDDYPADLDVSTAAEQLGMLGGASVDAVQQMKIGQDNRAAANEALTGFILDLALAAVPGGGKISALVSDDLKASFGNNSTINALIDEALSQGDTLNGQAVEQLKQDIADVLTDEQVDLAVLRENASNFMMEAALAGVSGEDSTHPATIKNTIQTVQDDIAEHRN